MLTRAKPVGDISWNFEKFLVGKDGAVLGLFKSKVVPDDPQLVEHIDQALASQSRCHFTNTSAGGHQRLCSSSCYHSRDMKSVEYDLWILLSRRVAICDPKSDVSYQMMRQGKCHLHHRDKKSCTNFHTATIILGIAMPGNRIISASWIA